MVVCVEIQEDVLWEVQGVQNTCRDTIRAQNQIALVGQDLKCMNKIFIKEHVIQHTLKCVTCFMY